MSEDRNSDANRNKDNPDPFPNRPYRDKEDDKHPKLWGVVLFGLIGATATTFAVGQLRRTVDWFYSQLSNSVWKGGSGKSFRTAFQEEAWRRYNRRMREEYEEEMERVERIRRMQSVFNRERNKYKSGHERWRENDLGGGGGGQYHQHAQRDDWYWKSDPSFRDRRAHYREAPPRQNLGYSLSSHYSVLGLDRFRTKPYTDAEIKTAFRAKAMEFHPDQNQENKDTAEAKFKEVMASYEAIKKEMKESNL